MFVPPNSTYAAIEMKVRRLTASPSEQTLSSFTIAQAVNTFYNQDFPYAIKLDQMRDVYTFYTEPYRDRYPLNINYNQGIREPIYFNGIQGYFYKDRDQFFRMWPRWPTKFTPFIGDGVTQEFNFISGTTPILDENISLGVMDNFGNPISVADDGNGNMNVQVPNPAVSVPGEYTNYPGMKNLNTMNPGDNVITNIGTVDYKTATFSLNFSLAGLTPGAGQKATLWVSQYDVGRPYCLLFWNNEFTIRPIPSEIHRVEVETYLTPVQFLSTTDNPIVTQWWQYIAYGSSREILRERQDMEGVANLEEGFLRQESLVLERQAVEEIGQRNTTIFSENILNQNFGNYNNGFY
jgi:hypothetical protein